MLILGSSKIVSQIAKSVDYEVHISKRTGHGQKPLDQPQHLYVAISCNNLEISDAIVSSAYWCALLMGALWLSLGPLSDQIPTLQSSAHEWCLNYSWCGVRIGMAIGSLP